MRISRVLAAGYVVLSGIDTWLAGSTTPRAVAARRLTKPALMPTLAAATATARPNPPRALLAAQGFSWGGDLALLGSSETAFLAGAGSFGVGHVGYLTLWRSLRDRSASLWSHPSTKVLVGSTLAAAPVIAWAAAKQNPVLAGPVAAYAVGLTAVAAQACALDESVDPVARRMIAAGALSFLASDTILGANMFVLPEKSALAERAVMATYTAAQGLLAAGALRATN